MKVFVTGGTGFIGASVVRSLLRRNHTVTCLARSANAAERLRSSGVSVVEADLTDLETLRSHVGAADRVVHTAFANSLDYERAIELDQQFVRMVIGETNGHSGHLLYTSSAGVLGDTGTDGRAETAPTMPPAFLRWCADLELRVLESGGTVIRSGLVYGHSGNKILTGLIRASVADGGHGLCVGEQGTVWSAAHVAELGLCYALAAERPAGCGILHASTQTFSTDSLARSISKRNGYCGAVRSIDLDEADDLEIPYAEALTYNQHLQSLKTRKTLGWAASMPSLLEDVESGSYAHSKGAIGARDELPQAP
jgi:nucleoside-diphosphate-sugar epimerase